MIKKFLKSLLWIGIGIIVLRLAIGAIVDFGILIALFS